MAKHAHRWTLRTGPQVVSSATPAEAGHRHEVRGTVSGPPMSLGGGKHIHMITFDNVAIQSGPPIPAKEAKKDMDDYGPSLGETMNKGILPDLVDPEHEYVFKTGEYGLYDYWYLDRAENYWKYSNAPEDSPDYDLNLGVPVMAKDQPTPSENPQFFTFEGKKRHAAVPLDLLPDRNEEYSPVSAENIWFEVYDRDGNRSYIYLDSDIRENIDLWVQYQLRVTDANIPNLRKFAVEKFGKKHLKDRILAGILMLIDQGTYELEELLDATVSDLEFIDNTVKLLGRKFITDPDFLDFLTSLLGGRDPSAPLFSVPSVHGEGKLGIRYVASVLKYLKVSVPFLLSWNASYLYSKVVNRLSFEDVASEEVDGRALSEVKRLFVTQMDVQALIDTNLRNTLLENYAEAQESPEPEEELEVEKSIIARVDSDEYGVLTVFSDLIGRREDEVDFSIWLHATPFHLLTPEEEAEVEEGIGRLMEEEAEDDEPGDEEVDAETVDDTGNKKEASNADQEAGAVDTDTGKEEI